MNNEYYLLDGEEKTGPFTYNELIEKEIDIHTQISTSFSNKWQYASELPEFIDYFESKGIYFPTGDNLANFGIRALAFMIDYIILFVPIEIVMIQMGLIVLPATTEKFALPSSHVLMIIQAVFSVVFLVYNTVLESTPLKGSIGKKICRLNVVDIDGQSPNIAKALGRNLGALLSLMIYGIPFLSMLFSEHRQTWYDNLAKAYVIIKPKA